MNVKGRAVGLSETIISEEAFVKEARGLEQTFSYHVENSGFHGVVMRADLMNNTFVSHISTRTRLKPKINDDRLSSRDGNCVRGISVSLSKLL